MKGKNRCVICYRKHNKYYHGFPKEFPRKWRMCCGCKCIASDIIRSNTKKVIDFYITIFSLSFVKITILKRKVRRINKLINVV